MAMKETEGSLKAYFLLAGVLAILLSIRDLNAARGLSELPLPTSWRLAIYVPVIARFVIGVGFAAAGFKLKDALQTGAGWIQTVLLVSIAILIGNGILITAVLGTGNGQGALISSVVGLVIALYLRANVRRLATEAMAQPPVARVV